MTRFGLVVGGIRESLSLEINLFISCSEVQAKLRYVRLLLVREKSRSRALVTQSVEYTSMRRGS